MSDKTSAASRVLVDRAPMADGAGADRCRSRNHRARLLRAAAWRGRADGAGALILLGAASALPRPRLHLAARAGAPGRCLPAHADGSTQPDRYLKVSPYYHLKRHKLDHLRRRLDTGGCERVPDLRRSAQGRPHRLSRLRQQLRDAASGRACSAPGRPTSAAASATARSRRCCASRIPAGGGLQDGGRARAWRRARSRPISAPRPASACCLRPDQARRRRDHPRRHRLGRPAEFHGDGRRSSGRQNYIDNLNGFFDNTAGAVADAGGEILSFIGDGFLAIFPSGRNQKEFSEACKLALRRRWRPRTGWTSITASVRRARRAGARLWALAPYRQCHVRQCRAGRAAVVLGIRLDRERGGAAGGADQEVRDADRRSEEFTAIAAASGSRSGREILARRRGAHGGVPAGTPRTGRWPAARVIQRSRVRDFSDAEAVIMLHRDTPA